MNGDLGIIYEELKELRKDINSKHQENLKTFGDLPCKAQEVKINIIYALMMLMVAGCVGGFWFLLRVK